MSRCPTDGPVLKSILGLYRPTADCLLPLSLSFSCCFNILSLSISADPFSLLFFHTHCHLSSPSLPPSSLQVSVSLAVSVPISHSFTFSSSSLSYLRPHPAIYLLFFGLSWCHRTNRSVSSHAPCVSLSLSLSPSSLLLFIVSLSSGVSPSGS